MTKKMKIKVFKSCHGASVEILGISFYVRLTTMTLVNYATKEFPRF